MVTYPDLSSLSSNQTIGSLLALPNASYPFFWAWILGGIWTIITLTLYFKEKERIGRTRILSDMSVASFATLILALIGTLVGFVPMTIMVYTLTLSVVIIAIWFFNE